VVGRGGVTAVLTPQLSDEEEQALHKSANNLKAALERVKQKG
jgi:malate/lactate dehydrogenase